MSVIGQCRRAHAAFIPSSCIALLALLTIVSAASAITVRAADLAVIESLTLEQAYDRALATDQNIRIAFEELRQARLLPWSALTRMGPNLSANASFIHPERDIRGTTPGTGARRVENKRGDVTLIQPLFDLSVFPALRRGRLAKEASRLAYRRSVRTALFGVTSAFYDVLKQQQILEVNRQTLDLATQQLSLAQNRFDVGEVTKTDVLRARVNRERAQRAVTETENSLQLARNILGNVLNYGVETDFVLAEPDAYPTDVDTLAAVEELATEQREDLRIAALDVQQSIALHREVAASYAPRVNAQVSNFWTDQPTTTQPNNFWEAQLGVTIPLFEGGQREIDMYSTDYEIEKSRLNQELIVKNVEVEVKEAWLEVKTLEQTLQTVKSEVDAAEESYRTIQNQYRAGAATSLDVFSALSDLNSAKTAHTVQTYDYQVALRNLELATGYFQDERVKQARQP